MSIRKQLVEVCSKVYKKGFVSDYDGNISCRLPSDNYLITRSGICKGDINEDDIVEINSKGNGKIRTYVKNNICCRTDGQYK